MARLIIALLAGLLFGLGLGVSQMVDPAKVLGFLDIAGNWDPSLIFVMGGAVAVTLPAFWRTLKRTGPVLGGKFQLPQIQQIDARLVSGSTLFGVGWGLVGYCPGPAISSLAFARSETLVFLAAVFVGSALVHFFPPSPQAAAA